MDKITILRDKKEDLITKDLLDQLFTIDIEKGKVFHKLSRQGATKGAEAGYYSSNGYRSLSINYKEYRVHRIIFFYAYGKFPTLQTDHINGIKDDNRISNLRELSNQDNCRARKKVKENKINDLPRGVSYDKSNKKKPFIASLEIGGKKMMKHFATVDEAIVQRVAWEKEFFILTPVELPEFVQNNIAV